MRYDPIEDDPVAGPLIVQAKAEAMKSKNVIEYDGHLGRCHEIWRTQKRILKEKYGIEWRTPPEMNPDWDFD
jgi:hypothetical protein